MRNKFMFFTSIENSYPTIMVEGKKVRIDELKSTVIGNQFLEFPFYR